MATFIGDDTRCESPMRSHIPIVTEHDLTTFHQKHFGNKPLPVQFFIQSEQEVEYEEYEEEDELGYYSDGVKRTLTDEQIAIFRHSEIQALIKEKEAQAANDEDISKAMESDAMCRHRGIQAQIKELETCTAKDADISKDMEREAAPIFARKDFQRHNNTQPAHGKRRARQTKKKKKLGEAATEQVKRRRNSSSDPDEPRKRQFLKEGQQDPDDFLSDGDEKTYRRKAREADEIKEAPVELDY